MSYYVKHELPCEDCGTLTNKRRPHTHEALCLECGLKRGGRQIRGMTDPNSDHKRRQETAFLAWVDSGGIDRADQPYKWKQGMRRKAERIRQTSGYPSADVSLTGPS